MDTLCDEIQKLEKYVPYYKNILNNFKHKNKFLEAFIHHKINRIIYLCDEFLIDGSGRCDWDNIDILCEKGYHVGPGEKDRFGWLTGMIYTSKGAIVYG